MHSISRNRKFAISSFVVLAALISTFVQMPDNNQSAPLEPAQTNDADYYMKKYSIISTNPQGVAQYWFEGNELNHYPDGTTTIDNPKITVQNEKQQIWTTTASQGFINNTEQLSLDGAVQIQQVNINHRPVKIKTDKLAISLHDKTAISEKPVSVETREGTVSAIGMQLDFANNKVKLLSSVKADYVAP